MADYAAWVQAVGSVVAIVIAGRTVELAARRARLERLYGVDGIFLFCAATVEDAAKTVQAGRLRPDDLQMFPLHRLKDCLAMLSSITSTVLDIGSEKLPQLTSDAAHLIQSTMDAVNASKIAIGLTNDIAANTILLHDNAKQLKDMRKTVLSFVEGQRRQVKRWWIPFG